MDTRSPTALHWIGGHWTRSMGSAEAESIDPATGDLVGCFAAGGAQEAADAGAAARDTFDRSDWSQNPRLRQDVLLAWAARLDARRAELAELLTRENGKILRQADG